MELINFPQLPQSCRCWRLSCEYCAAAAGSAGVDTTITRAGFEVQLSQKLNALCSKYTRVTLVVKIILQFTMGKLIVYMHE